MELDEQLCTTLHCRGPLFMYDASSFFIFIQIQNTEKNHTTAAQSFNFRQTLKRHTSAYTFIIRFIHGSRDEENGIDPALKFAERTPTTCFGKIRVSSCFEKIRTPHT